MSDRALLESVARRAMEQYGLEPDFPAAALAEANAAQTEPPHDVRDLRHLLWSSIDNDESRDLDQLEVCDGGNGSVSRVLIAIADVDAFVRQGDAVDSHAQANTTSIYTAARIFPMLPEALSTDKTSLLPDVDRAAIVIQIEVDAAGVVQQTDVYRAMVRNRAKLAYDDVGAWLEGTGPSPAALSRVSGLESQLRQQDRIAQALRANRQAQGALDFERGEVRPVMEGDRVADLEAVAIGRARDLIEDFMIAANGATSGFLAARHSPSLRRVVKTPERWPRIVGLAAEHGVTLPEEPDARALEAFLKSERTRSAETFDELSLSVIKLLGRGEYSVAAGETAPGHFALAVTSYSHSTAPNRRYPDLIMQRLLKAASASAPPSYAVPELERLAQHCTRQEDAANKVERLVQKAAAALVLSRRIGQEFDAVVTGASPKGTWVRIRQPRVEGKLDRGFEGLDVGDRVRVRLVSTDPQRGFIDFARADFR
jgi:VacB/RNase II family 3'-5' exoribonuclease